MAEAAQNNNSARSRPIFAWVCLAILIAAAVAVGGGILLGDETSTLEDYRRSPETADMLDLYVAIGAGVMISLAVWAAFHFAMFRKRARLWKSLVGLVLIAVLGTFAGVVSRAVTITTYLEQDREALRAIRTDLNQRMAAMRAESEAAGRALRADRGLPEFRSLADINNALAAIQAQRQSIRDFEAAADAEIERAKQEMLALDVYEGERVLFIEQIDEILSEDSATHRLFRLENALLDKQEEAVRFLLDNRNTWSFYEGSLQFHDRAALHRMNQIMSEAYEIIPQIDILEGAGGEGVPRASIPPAAPPPENP